MLSSDDEAMDDAMDEATDAGEVNNLFKREYIREERPKRFAASAAEQHKPKRRKVCLTGSLTTNGLKRLKRRMPRLLGVRKRQKTSTSVPPTIQLNATNETDDEYQEDEDEYQEESDAWGHSRKHYVLDKKESKQTLMCIALGLKDVDGSDYRFYPYDSIKRSTTDFKPTRPMLRAEAERRSNLLNVRAPLAGSNTDQLCAWLEANPIRDDIAFFASEVTKYRAIVEDRIPLSKKKESATVSEEEPNDREILLAAEEGLLKDAHSRLVDMVEDFGRCFENKKNPSVEMVMISSVLKNVHDLQVNVESMKNDGDST